MARRIVLVQGAHCCGVSALVHLILIDVFPLLSLLPVSGAVFFVFVSHVGYRPSSFSIYSSKLEVENTSLPVHRRIIPRRALPDTDQLPIF